MPQYDLIVIGGGASGMMAAGRAAELGMRVLLLEKNRELGKKLSITGGGRCNILNAEKDEHMLLSHYGTSSKYLYSAFAEFGMEDAYAFFESRGLPLKIETHNRAFPATERAEDVVQTLVRYMQKGNVEVRTGVTVKRIEAEGGRITKVVTSAGDFEARAYIIATGGVSHKETGSTGDGFSWLSALGHTIAAPTPTIVPLKTEESWVKKIAGVTLPEVKIIFFTDTAKKFSRTGPLLFTHFGISGPMILNSSGKVADLMHEGAVHAYLDIFPHLDQGALDKALTGAFDENKNKLLRNALRELLPPGTTDVLLSLTSVDPETKAHSVLKEDRRRIAALLKRIPLTISGLMGFDRAVVADGGVPLSEIDTRSMQSAHYENLFITGDLLHIHRPSGGYSLQLCWTTGFVAGTHAAERIGADR